jgi:hypothetical protein
MRPSNWHKMADFVWKLPILKQDLIFKWSRRYRMLQCLL